MQMMSVFWELIKEPWLVAEEAVGGMMATDADIGTTRMVDGKTFIVREAILELTMAGRKRELEELKEERLKKGSRGAVFLRQLRSDLRRKKLWILFESIPVNESDITCKSHFQLNYCKAKYQKIGTEMKFKGATWVVHNVCGDPLESYLSEMTDPEEREIFMDIHCSIVVWRCLGSYAVVEQI